MTQRLWRSTAPQHALRRFARAAAGFAIVTTLMSTYAAIARADENRPGTTDPLGGPSHYAMFRSDKLFTMLPISESAVPINTYAPSSDLSQLSQVTFSSTNYSQSVAATSGRITSPNEDKVALVRPTGSGQLVLTLTNGFFANYTLAYFFYPTFYTTKDGTVKVAYAVDPLGSNTGKFYWQARFAGKPNPALNLPNRFMSDNGEEWDANGMWSQRKMIRGFGLTSPTSSVSNPNPDPITGDYPKLVYAPVAGDTVRVAVQVYNYSLDTPAQNVRVRFQAVKYDDSTLKEIGDRVNIGDTLISLGSVSQGNQMGVAAINWDTTNFGPTTGSQEYRIYVVLNPKDTNPNYINNEIYPAEPVPVDWKPGDTKDTQEEGTFDPGQNNEGYGLVTVAAKPRANSLVNPTNVDVSMRSNSLAVAEPDGTFQTGQVQATLGEPILVRATVFSDQSSTEYSHLLLYDGDPANGGSIIADKQVFTGNASAAGSSVWVQLMPNSLEPGMHTLYAKVLEDPSDPQTGNNSDTLQVQVPGSVQPGRRIYLPFVTR